MKAVFGKDKFEKVRVQEWPAIGLLSSPLLNEDLATGKAGQSYRITGSAPDSTYADQQMKRIKSILSGGALPVRLILGSSTTVPPSLGKEFLNYSTIGMVLAFIAVVLVVVIRYRKLYALPPLIFTPVAEMLILISVLGSVGTLDLATIAGLFAAMGSSVNAQIIVSDDLFSAASLTRDEARQKIRRSFYIITRDAAVLALVMLPLLFSNIVEIIGFITALLLGTVLNIIITTQVYDAFGQSIAKE
jgi:preprotein translocase subunit SecD